MNWHDVKGWTDFDNIYADQVNNAKEGAVFVEIGTAYGKSAIMMAEKIKESGKNIDFFTIDPFTGSPDECDAYSGDMLALCLDNIDKCEVSNYIDVMQTTSTAAAKCFPKESIDFCFIDGLHTYPGVMEDLTNYWPLVKKGGTIAGHDYTASANVRTAVNKFFRLKGKRVVQNRSSWVVKK